MLEHEEVQRNSDGDWTHSALIRLCGDRELIPQDEWKEWQRSNNIEVQFSAMEYELDEDHPAWVRHYDEGEAGSLGWDPEPPGEDWRMLSIHDTEDGPVVIWYRELVAAGSGEGRRAEL